MSIPEKFVSFGTTIVTKEEYIKDIKNIAAFVGDYIGSIYFDRRNRLFSTTDSASALPLTWQPNTPFDPILIEDDHNTFYNARKVLTTYIDGAIEWINSKYSNSFLAQMSPEWDISYIVNSNGVLTISYTSFGNTREYYI
jgi:hypothetical protein